MDETVADTVQNVVNGTSIFGKVLTQDRTIWKFKNYAFGPTTSV